VISPIHELKPVIGNPSASDLYKSVGGTNTAELVHESGRNEASQIVIGDMTVSESSSS
jgi:hypothetical protein